MGGIVVVPLPCVGFPAWSEPPPSKTTMGQRQCGEYRLLPAACSLTSHPRHHMMLRLVTRHCSTSAPTHPLTSPSCLCALCNVIKHVSWHIIIYTCYMKKLRHDDVITKKCQKPKKAQILLKNAKMMVLFISVFAFVETFACNFPTNLPPARHSLSPAEDHSIARPPARPAVHIVHLALIWSRWHSNCHNT